MSAKKAKAAPKKKANGQVSGDVAAKEAPPQPAKKESLLDVYERPNILRLEGISLADYTPLEDLYEQRILEQLGDGGTRGLDADLPEDEELPQTLDKIPRVFAGMEEWPNGTGLLCHMCDSGFDGPPRFVPEWIRQVEAGPGQRGYELGVRQEGGGNTCTFNCAQRWIDKHIHDEGERFRCTDMLLVEHCLMTGVTVTRIEPAPSKYKMRKYGGNWDEETFWKHLRELDPKFGLKDHTPGSVKSERGRMDEKGVTPPDAKEPHSRSEVSVWDLCREGPRAPEPPASAAASAAASASALTSSSTTAHAAAVGRAANGAAASAMAGAPTRATIGAPTRKAKASTRAPANAATSATAGAPARAVIGAPRASPRVLASVTVSAPARAIIAPAVDFGDLLDEM